MVCIGNARRTAAPVVVLIVYRALPVEQVSAPVTGLMSKPLKKLMTGPLFGNV